jgi:hypothetical protein
LVQNPYGNYAVTEVINVRLIWWGLSIL